MQNSKCKTEREVRSARLSHFEFCLLHLALIDLDNAPALSLFRCRVDPRIGKRRRSLACRDSGERILLHLARHVLVCRRKRPAVQTYPQPEQRIREAVALLSRDDEVDVLE